MRRTLIQTLCILFACLASGSLECGGAQPAEAARRGAETYRRMCVVCHGAEGEGYKADQAPAIGHPAFLGSVADQFLRRSIAGGRGGTTMSAWGVERGGPLSGRDVDSLIALLHSWERGPREQLDEGPLQGDASRGRDQYATRCARCHGSTGTEGPYIHLGDQDLLSGVGNGFLRRAIRLGRPGTPMPGFEAELGSGGVEDVLAWLRAPRAAPKAPPAPAPPAHAPPLPLGRLPLNPKGPEPVGFRMTPATTPADAIKGQLDKGARMALLDARAPSDYANEHIAGAVSVPFYDVDPYVDQLPRDVWLVAYCACPHAESGQLAQKLAAKGFPKVTVLEEGIGVWRARNYGTRSGWEP
jgi:cytochrome c oxidase cbb3-type subunit 3/ubiquinol-cytochrome c reductase cytochrome c subunit